MASNINQVVLIVSIALLLLALFPPQAESSLISNAPAPVDAKTQMTRFINSAMIFGMQKTRESIQGFDMQVKDPSTSEPMLECLQECKDVYEAAIEDMQNTIEDMEAENYYKVHLDISSISANVDTCTVCYTEMVGDDFEAKTFSDWAMGFTNDCLDRLEGITS